MLLKIDFENEVPIYLQLRNQIVLGIASGVLQSGESLPSVRQLAADLGINLHTVNKAYTALRAEGFLAVHKREGVIVRRREEMAAPEGFERRLRAELEPSAAEAICRSLDEVAFLKVCAEVYRLIQGGRQT